MCCREINNLDLTDEIVFHGITAKDVIHDFIAAVEDIDDQGDINDLSSMALELYEVAIDESNEAVQALFNDERPLYDKRRGRKRKYQHLIDRNDPDVYDRQAERRRVIQRPLGRKLDI